ncbi:MAG: DUF3667 domain-containing protein [Bacteroidales bacterium]|jgi:hypothetical protein|nr:DUF3667 domain-containing protein [Bacteroidales bacterium]
MKIKINWLKKKPRPLPADRICRNCGTRTFGRYCHVCGQDLLAGEGLPFFKLIGNFLENAFALNNKTPITLGYLMIRPGFLSTEYRLGRIKKYVHPVKLLWISTLIFFALLISRADFGRNTESDVADAQQTAIDAISDSVAKQKAMQIMNAIPDSSFTDIPTTQKTSKQSIDPKEVEDKLLTYFSRYAPYAAFLFIPIFALLLMVFFWRSKFYYVYHFVFAMYFHVFLWVFCAFFLVLFWIFPTLEFPKWLSFILFFLPGVYLSIAFHRFYLNQTRWKAIWKSIVIGFLYFIMIVFGTTALILLVLKIMGVF